jgi:hypothetical protein
VHDQPRYRLLDVEHLQRAAARGDGARVRLLAAALRVEGGGVQDQLHHVTLAGLDQPAATAAEQRAYPGLARDLVVPGEFGRAALFQGRAVGRQVDVAGLARLRVGLGPPPLLGHQPVEALLVHGKALLRGDLQGQVDREAVRVVQLEGLVPGQR